MLTPLERAERYLAVRCLALERQLPLDGGESPLWREYVEAVGVLTRLRAQLARPLARIEPREASATTLARRPPRRPPRMAP
jgi:hypothetical protein